MMASMDENIGSPAEVNGQVAVLYEITRALSSSLDLEECLGRVLEFLPSRLEWSHPTVTILNPRTGELSIRAAKGLTDEAKRRGRYRLGEGVTGRVVATGQPAVILDLGEEEEFLHRTRSRGDLSKTKTSFICVPISAGAEVLGALSIDLAEADQARLKEDQHLLTIIAGLIAQTVKNIQGIQMEREELLTDNLHLRRKLAERYQVANIIGHASRMQEVFDMIHRVAGSRATVLIRGESGTGKELVANAIHYNSDRAECPLVKVNCAALPEGLLESELFGHEKGAFTGASHRKKGRFEQAEGGTIFLDEIGDLSPTLQTKLLRVIQEREFTRVGGLETITTNVRIIAATHQDLEELLTQGKFREDLYYRLNVFPIYLPPVRERRSDILLLAEHFLEKYNLENGKHIRRISTPAIDLLMQYHWPGNVRELQNVIERAVLVCDEDVIKGIHLPPSLQTAESSDTTSTVSLATAVANFERELIIEALKQARGVRSRAARILSTSNRIINYKISKYAINVDLFRGD
jgi:Nif-specific regulatory protein